MNNSDAVVRPLSRAAPTCQIADVLIRELSHLATWQHVRLFSIPSNPNRRRSRSLRMASSSFKSKLDERRDSVRLKCENGRAVPLNSERTALQLITVTLLPNSLAR